MIFHKEKKLCLFMPPRTGSTTARIFLAKNGWNLLKPEHGRPDQHLKKYPNIAEYKAHVFLRNPLTKFVSSILFLKRVFIPNGTPQHFGYALVEELIKANGLDCTVESLSYDQVVDLFPQFKEKFGVMFLAQVDWATMPGTEVLDFDNYEAELRRISGAEGPIPNLNPTRNDYGKSVVTQKVIDFVRQEYAADYALAKDRLGKEFA